MSNGKASEHRSWAQIAAAPPVSNKDITKSLVLRQNVIDQSIQTPPACDQVVSDNSDWDQEHTPSTASSVTTSEVNSASTNTNPASSPVSYYPLPVFQHEDEVLVCIDVECHCRNQSFEDHKKGIRNKELRPCEIGLTIFDTRALDDSETGDRFTNAWPKLKTHSIGIIENKHLKKGSHAPWCKRASTEDFLFGRTTWVSKDKFKRHFVHTVLNATERNKNKRAGLRKMTFLVFGPNDDKWLKSLDLNLGVDFKNSSVVDIQQTKFARILGRRLSKQQIGAHDLFAYLGIPTGKTHNGGNDSLYEMQAYLAMHALSLDQWLEVTQGKGELEMLKKTWTDESVEVLERSLIDLNISELPVL